MPSEQNEREAIDAAFVFLQECGTKKLQTALFFGYIAASQQTLDDVKAAMLRDNKAAVRELVQLAASAKSYLETNAPQNWLDTPTEALSGKTPRHCFLSEDKNDIERLKAFILDLI